MVAPHPPLNLRGAATPLHPDDIAAVAARYGMEPAVIAAVVTVETGGAGGFLTDGRPRILYEAHIFGRLTDHRYDKGHPRLSRMTWDRSLYLGGAAEYGRLEAAMKLDRNAALKAASWGLFQILGGNHAHAGHRTVEAFITAMTESERAHLDAWCAFIEDRRMVQHLAERDWSAFARAYNGPGHALNRYAEKLEAAYREAAGVAPALPPGDAARPVLRIGSKGAAVRTAQQRLREREAHLTVDGIFGRATEAAVVRLQRAAKLTADGIIGPLTWGALERGAPASPRPFARPTPPKA
jgi:hypothetical protein